MLGVYQSKSCAMINYSSKNLYIIGIIVNKIIVHQCLKRIDLSKIAGLAIMGGRLTKFVSQSRYRSFFRTCPALPSIGQFQDFKRKILLGVSEGGLY